MNDIPEKAVYRGSPSPERVKEIQYFEFPQVGDWIYRRVRRPGTVTGWVLERWQYSPDVDKPNG